MLQRGFPLSGMNFDSPGAAGKKFSRRKAREFFGAPAGISPAGDKLRLPGSSRKKIPPPKGEGIFFGAPAGIRTPDTLLKRQVLCLLSYWGISVRKRMDNAARHPKIVPPKLSDANPAQRFAAEEGRCFQRRRLSACGKPKPAENI